MKKIVENLISDPNQCQIQNVDHNSNNNPNYDLIYQFDYIEKFFPDKKVCMFDIETTGLNAQCSFTYIIGINIKVNGIWQIIQLFNDDGESEPEIIREFQSIIKDYDVLVEFNGDRFDIPYIEKRMAFIEQKYHIRLTDNFDKIRNFDLMKIIRPYKFALGLPNIKQKTIEKYFGINRIDKYNGGELINIYLDYLTSGNERHKAMVLRHNRDDMEGMILLGPILAIEGLVDGRYQISDIKITRRNGNNPINNIFLEIILDLEFPLASEIDTSGYECKLWAKNNKAILTVPIKIDTLRYYYSECQRDGFEEKEGFFVSSLKDKMDKLPTYKECARKKECYYLLDDNFLGNKEFIMQYSIAIISQILQYKGR
ncbi:MAG: ribonuclease H-like domain-containing protein [Eubacterium sp.]|nr:ribonuclease H-like domain-containing protein [Eubacterium sp.]